MTPPRSSRMTRNRRRRAAISRHSRRGKYRRRAAAVPSHPMARAQQGQVHLLAMHLHPGKTKYRYGSAFETQRRHLPLPRAGPVTASPCARSPADRRPGPGDRAGLYSCAAVYSYNSPIVGGPLYGCLMSAELLMPSNGSSLAASSYLETDFPYWEVSSVARANRFSRDGVYASHKWWARRPPSVIRALLLAAILPPTTSRYDFWKQYSADDAPLTGLHVGDPFMGGGTTLVEAGRLGAAVTGIDVDPLAVLIGQEELSPADAPGMYIAAARDLIEHLRRTCGGMYNSNQDDAIPLHYFWLREVHCSTCGYMSLLYRNLILARDLGKKGAVVRERGSEVFCPECRTLHHVPEGQETFTCCRKLHNLEGGTFAKGVHTCPACGQRRKHEQLKTARLPRILIAIEETRPADRRRFRSPTPPDLISIQHAQDAAEKRSADIPSVPLAGVDYGRPAIYGISTVGDIFSPRQQVVFAEAFAWLERCALPHALKRRLQLAASNALAANNMLCGYAIDYGRLAPLFTGVRSYSMPILSVELNPLHPSAGRGTLPATLRRVQKSTVSQYQRYSFQPKRLKTERVTFTARRPASYHVECQSAEKSFPDNLGLCDIMLTDPPYFDYIAYSDLSLVFRAWIWRATGGTLGGTPIYPEGGDPVGSFASHLGSAFASARYALKPEGVIIFTFHSANPDAWKSLSRALRTAGLVVTTVFPVWTDAGGVAHAHPGKCEWDLVFTCRPAGTSGPPSLPESIDTWLSRFGKKSSPVGKDLDNLRLGLEAAHWANNAEAGSRYELE
jgi:putative DNA methylase